MVAPAKLAACGAPPAPVHRLPGLSRSSRCLRAAHPTQHRRGARQHVVAQAILDPQQTTAVTQQIVAYAVLIAGEGFWATWRMEPQPGKPNVFQTVIAIVSLLAVTALMQNEGVQTQAEIAGMAVSALLLAYYVKRAFDVRDPEGLEWPGPKASPGGMALVAFFSLNIFFQSFRGV